MRWLSRQGVGVPFVWRRVYAGREVQDEKDHVHEQSGGHAVRGESVSRHLLHGHTAPAPSANIRFLTFCPFLTAAQALQWREPQEFKVRALVRQRLAHLGTAVGAIRPP